LLLNVILRLNINIFSINLYILPTEYISISELAL